jgi:hypothetical protein
LKARLSLVAYVGYRNVETSDVGAAEMKRFRELNSPAGDESPNRFGYFGARHLRPLLKIIHDSFRRLFRLRVQMLQNRGLELFDGSHFRSAFCDTETVYQSQEREYIFTRLLHSRAAKH